MIFFVKLLIIAVIIRIAYTDYKSRKIGKLECAVLLLLGSIISDNLRDSFINGMICFMIPETVNYICSDLKGLGGGDLRLMFLIGWIFNMDKGLIIILFSGVSILIFYLIIVLIMKKTLKYYPMAPFMAPWMIAALFININI